ncbi:beta-1,6-N-acetylglucosaminyltransferase [Aurantibacillus circumpalustris]|uniref:beta-1,6-N-acetylglucosaminyltransferase n=1 Tax=Aurantibacillus circumpalustris TaxID=3036359 RepID=UPI00295C0B48|nr:beta-1,6-N-acetylglucosaminyltransferase [Aurantibacillus circumpalustris]
MKQAILITAYKNVHHLQRIINCFDENYFFYIHIDKKSRLSEQEILNLQKNKNVALSRRYKTNWGGMAHLKSILLLMNMALENKQTKYIHLISGHDFPIKSPLLIDEFLTKNSGKQFLEFFQLPTPNWENGGMDRVDYYNLHDYIDAKGRYGFLIHKCIRLQKKLNLKRAKKLGNLELFGGSTWWTLSSECCLYIQDYIYQNPSFLKKFNFTFCAEEFFFQTLILNSPFKDHVVNDNLRHIVWELRHGNMPAVLDETDYETLKSSPQLFARRFEYPFSEKLVGRLESGA